MDSSAASTYTRLSDSTVCVNEDIAPQPLDIDANAPTTPQGPEPDQFEEQDRPLLVKHHDGFRKPIEFDPLTPPIDATDEALVGKRSKAHTRELWNFEDWWVGELAGLLGSAWALIGIVVLLYKHAGRQQPAWTWVSLNSLVSWLSAVAKILVLMPVTKGIGQLKWIWFSEEARPLGHLRTFDAASRGLVGSVELLWKLRSRHFAAVGGITVILSLGFDPFVQNLIHYYPYEIEDSSKVAKVANTSWYDVVGPFSVFVRGSGSETSTDTYWAIDPNLKANIYNALFNVERTETRELERPYVCSTGNCTWDPISTLEFQSACSDVSLNLNKSCDLNATTHAANCTLYTKGGPALWFLDNMQRGMRMIIETVDGSGLVYNATPFPIIRSILPAKSTAYSSFTDVGMSQILLFVATECKLEPVVRTFLPVVKGGKYSEETVSFSSLEWAGSKADKLSDFSTKEKQNGPTFGFDETTWESLNYFFRGFFSGSVLEVEPRHLKYGNNQSAYGTGELMQTMFHSNFSRCEDPSRKLECLMPKIADAFTKTIRDAPYNKHGFDGANMTVGNTKISVTFVEVRWHWLTLPVFIWILSAVTWVGTLWRTRRAKVQTWRNDPLPLLFLYRGTGSNSEELKSVTVRPIVGKLGMKLVDA